MMSRPGRWQRRWSQHEERPIDRIDTRPHLVFCTLLAIIMLLAAIGQRTHALLIDFAYPGSDPDMSLGFPVDRVIVTADGHILWNAVPVSQPQFRELLDYRSTLRERTGLIFEPEGRADYAFVLAILAEIKTSGNAGAGFCFGDLSLYRSFGKTGSTGTPVSESDLRSCNPAADSRFDRRPAMPGVFKTPANPPLS